MPFGSPKRTESTFIVSLSMVALLPTKPLLMFNETPPSLAPGAVAAAQATAT